VFSSKACSAAAVKDLASAYGHDKYRKSYARQRDHPHITRRGEGHGSELGTIRWLVERTIAVK
jgi:hypothetical protein